MAIMTQVFYGVACFVGAYVFYRVRKEQMVALQEMKLLAMFDSLTTFQNILRAVGYFLKGAFEAAIILYAVGGLWFLFSALRGVL